MKSLFTEHLHHDETYFQNLWERCVFVFDANTLLNFYRYSQSTSLELREALSLYSERVWLPNQVVVEYFRNRLTVINSQKNNYNEPLKNLNAIKETFSSRKGHPFISQELLDKFEDFLLGLNTEFMAQQSQLDGLILNDEFSKFIIDLFDNKVGKPFPNEKLVEIYKEGKIRYENKIPPGFGDNKPEPDRYGDLVIWNQIINKSLDDKIDIVFVTDDEKKGDWSLLHSGKNLGPLPSLKKEFNALTGKDFHIYPAFRFLELAYENNNKQINVKAVTEVKEVSRYQTVDAASTEVHHYEIQFDIDFASSKTTVDKFNSELISTGYSVEFLNLESNQSTRFVIRLPFNDLVRRFKERLDILLKKHDLVLIDIIVKQIM
ncbi:PIN-like domain-containing protein [Hymenobacter terricola]|uniref:PIN-like domain-containing protein n=1 Tax=Hymenobacter terricola TaxID=2819236 RepID=UPI001B300E8A|nr:PIN-like domain-containing protein [Hymenobacter terricola]